RRGRGGRGAGGLAAAACRPPPPLGGGGGARGGGAAGFLAPPVLAALRLGLYELLFADGTPDHAAVDQAVELVKGAGAGHAAGFANAILRRAARERGRPRERLADGSTPRAAAGAAPGPGWRGPGVGGGEVGGGAARALLASCNEPAEVALRADGQLGAALEALRAAEVDASPAAGEWPLGAPESIVLRGRAGTALADLVAAGRATPQSRGSAAVVE